MSQCNRRFQMMQRLPFWSLTGMQWGDEGKGRLIDVIAGQNEVSAVARWHGGANAGHTIVVDGEETVTHLVPSGVLQGKIGLVGQYCVVDPVLAMQELVELRQKSLNPEVYFDQGTNLIMPWHFAMDKAREIQRGANKIGTTSRGIGPCYEDRARRGTRLTFNDLVADPGAFEARFRQIAEMKVHELKAVRRNTEPKFKPGITELISTMNRNGARDVERYLDEVAPFLKEMVKDTALLAAQMVYTQKKRILFEGAHGMLLDVDYGTRPFVTSSNISPCAIPIKFGMPVNIFNIGVLKAYQTRVGEGPMPTEDFGNLGNYLQQTGGEVGATTGRNRRCGPLDLVLASYTSTFGIQAIAMTKVDVLAGIDPLQICIGYKMPDGSEIRLDEQHPNLRGDFNITQLAEYEPIYENLPSFDIPNGAKYGCCRELPENLRNYVHRVSDLLHLPVAYVTFGPDRDQYLDVLDCNLGRNPCDHHGNDSSGGCGDCNGCS